MLTSTSFTIENLVSDERVTSIVVNRSGIHGIHGIIPELAFTTKTFCIEEKSGSHNINLFYPQLGKVAPLTKLVGSGVFEPAFAVGFSPGAAEDSLVYLKNGQLWQSTLSYPGDAIQVTNFSLPIETYKIFSGFENQIWLVACFDVFPTMTPRETCIFEKQQHAQGSSGVVFDSLMVRHWDKWAPYKKRHHLFLCPIEITSTGEMKANEDNIVDIMYGLDVDCPGKRPGNGSDSFVVSPDGRHIAFVCSRFGPKGEKLEDFAWATDNPLYLVELPCVVDLMHTFKYKLLSNESCRGYQFSPNFSYDGKYLAVLTMKRSQYESDLAAVNIIDVESFQVVFNTENIDISFDVVEWASSGYDFFSSGQYQGTSRIFHFQLNSNLELCTLSVMSGECNRSCPLFVSNDNATLYFLESSLVKPNEIKMMNWNDMERKKLFCAMDVAHLHSSSPGKSILDSDFCHWVNDVYVPCPHYTNGDLEMSTPEKHYFVGGSGDLVQAWYLPPCNLSDGKKAPLLLIVHGGPQGAIVNGWNYRWNMSIFASQGYGVLAVNFHGSTGFGQSYCDSIKGDWGGKPFIDCLKGVDYILGCHDYLDVDNVAALGASYGGYMMNWMNGHTDRFKCFVNHCGIFSIRSLFYTTEEIYFPEWEFGLPWENKSSYEHLSPDSYITQWKTPVLVIQGGKDFRVSETEGISTFTALQRKGIDSKFLYFPDENHWVLKPMNSIMWHETVFSWLKKYLYPSVE